MSDAFYLTTTLPYVNAEPHIGFAWEITEADVIARAHRQLGQEVVFNTGTDEHGSKIYQKAQEAGQDPQTYTDIYAAKFSDLQEMLNLSYTNFIRTTDAHHKAGAQEFWRRVDSNGYIYKKFYSVKYCVGCELEKTDSELVDGRCPLHPNYELEHREEENYFFKFSEFQGRLLELYAQNPSFVRPAEKMKEIQSFVEHGLQDFSISRLKSKMPWGVQVPGDDDHVMYVWFDALANYITTLGWPEDTASFERFWPGVQLAGKDNLRQQAAMWQAMLMAADLPASQAILINGFISVGGQKMSKSLGNVISPREMVDRYGVDGTRFLLINLGTFAGDVDVTWERFDTEFTASLSNGLGNLASRVAKMCEKEGLGGFELEAALAPEFVEQLAVYDLTAALRLVMAQVEAMDKYLAEQQPWKQTGDEKIETLEYAVAQILSIALHIESFLPETAAALHDHFTAEKITAIAPLFPRVEVAA